MPTDAATVMARRTMPPTLASTAAAVALLLAGCASAPLPEQAKAPVLPAATEAFAVAGLERPAELLIDRWGVPHSYAASTYDAFIAQGFAAARDRLWQMDLWRKRGLGQMASDFGPNWVEGDRMARAVLFRGDMYREWLAYGSDAKRVAEAFVAGVNAWVAQVNAKPEALLPMEFKLLGYRPVPWLAEDVVRIRHHGLTLNYSGEIDRAQALCLQPNGKRVDWLRRELDPPVLPKLVEGFDPCSVPAAVLKAAYAAATAPPAFSKTNIGTTSAAVPLPPTALADADTLASYGSNNWVIAPERTDTGRPLLANDPHRAHGAPSLRYVAHISAPGMDVIGAGEPFLPGISIGHNGTIAFGLTRFYMDQEDLYVYETNPQRPDEYNYQGRWEPMMLVTEEITVKGEAAPRKVVNRYTRHGPVMADEGAKHRAWALRAAWLDLGMAPYFGSMDYMRARNWDQFRAAMNRWGAPGENQVYADTQGNIGWVPGGLTPIRPNWDGLTPVPGDGRYEWAGFRHGDELPREFNPARGYVVTANENNIPPDSAAAGKGIGYEWADDARSRRLKALFAQKAAAGERFSLSDSQAMQTDIVSSQAQRVVKVLQGVQGSDAQTTAALQMLKAWDGTMDKDSAAAALYEVWFAKHLRPAVLNAALGEAGAKAAAPGDSTRVLELIENPTPWMPIEQRNALIEQSLRAASAELQTRLGPDMAQWKWGALHRAEFRHPLSSVVDPATRKLLDVGDWPMSGSGFTPMAASYRPSDWHLTAGASFRMVLDVGNWDASRFINTPGQSGDSQSPHYRDLAPLWLAGQYVPLAYSRAAVERNTVTRIRLEPGR